MQIARLPATRRLGAPWLACCLAAAAAATATPTAEAASFERSDGRLVTTAAGWRVAFSEVDGSCSCGPAEAGWPGALRDGADGLWRATFLDGSVRRAAEFGAEGARRFAWALDPGGAVLHLTWDGPELLVTVRVRARDDGVDLEATLEARQGTVVELALPAEARFDPSTLRRLVVPGSANETVGIAFSRAFFEAQPVDHPAGWKALNVGSAAYRSLYGGSLTSRPDADPKVALEVTAAGAAWFDPELESLVATSRARVNRPPAAGQEGTVLVTSANGAYLSANRVGGAGSLLRIGGGVDDDDVPLVARLVEGAIEHLATAVPPGRTDVALIDLERGPARGWWAAVPVGEWRRRLSEDAALRSAGLRYVSLTSIPQLEAALAGTSCLAIVNPYGEAAPVPAAGGMPAMASALQDYVRAGGFWFETGGHPFYHELVPDRYLEYAADHPPGFADFLHCELASGGVAIYGVQPRDFPPWAAATDATRMFVPGRLRCGGDATGGSAGRAFATFVPEGARWSSPAVRVRLGADAWQALRSYAVDNGIDRPLEEKVGAEALAKLETGLMVYYGGTAEEKSRYLGRLPSPTLIHFADYLHGGFDKQYPDHLPPNEAFGTAAELRAFLDQARSAGHLVMPYSNPTWWCDHPRGPTFLREGEAPLLRRADGSLSYEVYGTNDGYTVCHWHPAVRAANRATLDRFTLEYPVDVLFQDQCGARGWAYDHNPASPGPLAYTEGLVSMVAADSLAVPLATEGGWDAIVDHEALLCGMTWALVPTRDPPSWRTLLRDRYPPATWTIFPVAQAIAHDRAILLHHDLGQFVTDDEVLTWTLGLGFSLSARVNAGELENRSAREWLYWLDRVQKSVCARWVGQPVTEFEHDRSVAGTASDDGAVRARYGPVAIVANLNARALTTGDIALAPHGFLADAPGMRAGIVAAPESPDDPFLSASFAIELAADASDAWIYSRSDREVTLPWPDRTTASVTAELDDGSFLPATLDRGRLRLALDAPPGVERSVPPAELEAVSPSRWPGGPPAIGVLDLPGQPTAWTKVSAADWMAALTASRVATDWHLPIQRIATIDALFGALAAGPPRWLAIVNPGGEGFPETGSGRWRATLDAIREFVRRGGHWVETGGYSFYSPAWRDGGVWRTETIGPAGAGWLGLPVASGPLDRPPELVAPTAEGAELLGEAWAALLEGRTTVVNRGLATDASDPGHLTLLAGPSGDFFGGYRLDGWGFLWRLGGMNPDPAIAVPTIVATLEWAASHPPLAATPGPARYLWHATVRLGPEAGPGEFTRGDANADGATDISDAVAILNYLFLGLEVVPCDQAGDANDDGSVDISDAIFTLGFLFLGGEAIAPPVGTCGLDPSGHDLACESFPPCP